MNRLWVHLTFAIVSVTLVGVFSVAVLADLSASQAFRHYVERQDMVVQSGLLDDLALFYQRSGNWNGVEDVFSRRSSGNGNGQQRGRPSLLLVNQIGIIVYDERDDRVGGTLTVDEQANALPIVVNGKTVGILVVVVPGDGNIPSAAQQFLDQLRSTLLIVALVVGSLGILLGFIISRALTAPLSQLALAARALAARDWKHRVKVSGTDEVAQVGRAFNDMASELERIEIVRHNLVADIAHELRTPLTVMQGNLQAMLDEVYPLERSEIATLYDEARFLTRLVDDLRELSLADAGQLPLKRQALDVAPILRTVATHFSLAAQAQNVQLAVNIDETLPLVCADADRLAQVLRNLLANALHHTPSGGHIQITTASRAHLCISVSDTGKGIAADDLAHVFERFYRVEKARTRAQSSTGLGLAICKAWIEAMGGEVGAESVMGQGSRFWFTLPFARKTEKRLSLIPA
jgi:two-component system OmpR family sensor kinase/two-component system sensor histidine kinase BaeS